MSPALSVNLVHKSRALTALVAATMLIGAAAPQSYVVDASASSVSAKVPFFGLASKTAQFPRVAGKVIISPETLDDMLLDVTLDAKALTAPDSVTLERLRGKSFFWVEKYPTVRFVGTKLTMRNSKSGTISGKLTARGITRSETLAVTFDTSPASAAPGKSLNLSGEMTIDRRNYGMTAFQVIVGKKVKIRLKARIVPS